MAIVYSCCFWFSLRLGGIIIAFISIVQAIATIIIIYLASEHIDMVKQCLLSWIENINLSYLVNSITNFCDDPDKYISYLTILLSTYIVGCIFYIYGAFKLINFLMAAYIFLELLRLVACSFFMITGLLLLKQNTMDIGLLIGISVFVGFILLGMFYLWICAANLPILINEMKHDEQKALIASLHKRIRENHRKYSSEFIERYTNLNGYVAQNRNEFFFCRNHAWGSLLPPHEKSFP